MSKEEIAEGLASYGTSLKYEDLSPEVLHKLKGLLVDTLGCALGGYDAKPSQIARSMAGKIQQCDMPATILGSGAKSCPDLATFANGVMIRYLDFNDGFMSVGGGHPSDNFAPVLTCADAIHANGRDVIVASVLAYEVFCRLLDQFTLTKKGFEYSVAIAISGTVGASKILGLSQTEMFQAINLATAPNLSLRQTRVGAVSMWKGCASANAARNAVFAALLAKEGMTGPQPIFEGRFGFFNAVSGPFRLEEFGDRNKPFRMMNTMIKRYPCGQHAQTAIDAALKLRRQLSDIREVSQIDVETYAPALRTMAGDSEKWHPKTRETADHSIPYVVAIALMHGDVTPRYFGDQYRNDASILGLMQKIRVKETEQFNKLYPDSSPCNMEIVTQSGMKLSELVMHHQGHYRNPLTDREIELKFNSLADGWVGPTEREELLKTLWMLEKVDDIFKVFKLSTIRGRNNCQT